MIRVTVGVDDVDNLEVVLSAIVEDAILIAARIDNGGLLGRFAGSDVTADSHHANSELFNKHRPDPFSGGWSGGG